MIVRTIAAWTVFILVSVVGLFTLLTRHSHKPVRRIAEFQPYPTQPGSHILRHEQAISLKKSRRIK